MRLAVVVQTPDVPREAPLGLLTGSFAEKLSKAAQWGADGVELLTVDPSSLDRHSLRVQLRNAGLEVAAISSGALRSVCDLALLAEDRDRATKAARCFTELIHFAADVEAPLVTVGGFRGRVAGGGPNVRARLVGLLRETASHAARYGVCVALEPLNRYETDIVITAEEGLLLVREVDQASFGIMLDTFHVNIEERGWIEPFRQVAQAGRLWHIHLGDNNRSAAGFGHLDFSSLVSALREMGYDGYLSAEHLAIPDPDAAARQTLSHMRRLLYS